MSIAMLCPGCSKTLKAPAHAAGKTVKCPKCQVMMLVPGAPVEDFEVVEEPLLARPPVQKTGREQAEVDRPLRRRPERPPPKRSQKSGKSNTALFAGLGLGGVVVLVVAILLIKFVKLPEMVSGQPASTSPNTTQWTHVSEGGYEFDLPGGPVLDHERGTGKFLSGKLNADSITRPIGSVSYFVHTMEASGVSFKDAAASRKHLESIMKDVKKDSGTASEITLTPTGHPRSTIRVKEKDIFDKVEYKFYITVVTRTRGVTCGVHSEQPIDENDPRIQRFMASFVVDN